MRPRPLFLLALTIFVLGGCSSYMHVTTEVYVGKLPQDGLPATVAETASIARSTLDGYEERVLAESQKSYETLLRQLMAEYPMFFGTPEDSLDAFQTSFTPEVRKALAPVHDIAKQARLLAAQLGAPSDPPVVTFKEDANLEQGLTLLKELIERTGKAGPEAARAIGAAETKSYRDVLRMNFLEPFAETKTIGGKQVEVKSFPHDKLLAQKTGQKIKSDAARKKAVEKLIGAIEEFQVAGDEAIERALASPVLAASRLITTAMIVPFHDPAIPMILTADEKTSWKKAVNDVVSLNRWGNSEVAFRMDNLGDSHIKGILFDPSDAMKTGFNVFTKALEITASAYGANFSPTQTTTTDTTQTANESPGTPPAPSKPAIDTELARNAAKASARSETMELLFRRLLVIADALPENAADLAPGAAKKLLEIVKSTQDELADPTGRECGGE